MPAISAGTGSEAGVNRGAANVKAAKAAVPSTVFQAVHGYALPKPVQRVTPAPMKAVAGPGAVAAPKPVKNVVGAASSGRYAAITSPSAAITAATAAAKGGGGIVGRLLGQIASLPKDTVVGVTQLPGLVEHPSRIGTILKSDPIYQSISQGSLKPLAQDPLGTLLDASVVYGAAGRGLGALSRAGALGEDVKAATSLARTPRVLTNAEGDTFAKQTRAFSPNLFTQMIQKHLDSGVPGRAGTAALENQIKKGVATDHAAEQGVKAAETKMVQQEAKRYKPPGRDEQAAARFVIPYGTRGTGDIKSALQATRHEVANNPQAFGATAKTRDAILKQLDSAIANPHLDEASILHAAEGYGQVQARLEDRLSQLGVRTQEHMDNAKRVAYLQQQPGVHFLPKSVSDPRLFTAVKDARDALRTAKQDWKTALREQAPAEVEKAHEAQVNDAAKALAQAVKDYRTKKLSGTVIEDQTAPAMTSGPLKGLSVRPTGPADFHAALAGEPAGFEPSYLTARNMTRDRIEQLREAVATDHPRLAQSGRAKVTGEAVRAGDVNPGWGGVVRSQLNTVNALSAERELQNFMGRYADPTAYPSLTDAQRAAEAQPLKMTTIEWHGAYRNVPKVALDELQRQFEADYPKAAWKLLTKPNRLFRNTVLAMSTKLPIMHTVENLSRTALHEGALAPVRAPLDFARGLHTLHAADRLDPELGQRLRQILTPGSLSHSGEGALGEDAGKLAIEQAPVRAAAQRFSQALGTVPHAIIRLQRSLEQPAQVVALGAHGRQMLQEWGHSWLDANTAVKEYTDQLARGLADPAEAQRAAQSMHNLLGQYNAFTARQRLALRFVPFGSWYANAARLVLVTLPKDHPLFSALVHDAHQAVAKQWDAQHAGLPEDMQSSLKVGPSAFYDVGKLLPIGVPDPTLGSLEQTAQQLAVPEFSGPALDLIGKGPFLSDLYGPNTPYGKNEPAFGKAANMAAIESIIEEMGGPANHVARALFGHGGTMYNTDTPVLHLAGIGSVAEKPGSQTQQKGPLVGLLGQTLDREFDPLRPTTYGTAGGGGTAAFGRPEGTVGGAVTSPLGAPEGHL